MKRKLKIFGTVWHVAHWWDLCNALKDDADFFICVNHNRIWGEESRPMPDNAHYVSHYEEGIYDFAILNVDQQLANEKIGKRRVFKELNETIQDIPKVVINHGSPVYPEFLAVGDITKKDSEEVCRTKIKELIGDLPMVVNSHAAASDKEWGWGYPIIHGMNPDDWWDLPKEPRVFTALSRGGCDEYYNRFCMRQVASILKEYGYELWWAKENTPTGKGWDQYREWLGRSLIYLDTSFRTPMNRGRTEAMFSGCCVVQVKRAHDIENFCMHNDNMILVDNNPDEIANKVIDLIENKYDDCVRIGQNAKKTAIEKFSRERYRQDWLKFIKEVLKVKI